MTAADVAPLRVLVLDQGAGLWGAQRHILRLRPLLEARGITLTLGCPDTLQQYGEWERLGLPVVPLDLPIDRAIRAGGRFSATRLLHELHRTTRAQAVVRAAVDAGAFDMVLANSHWTHVDSALARTLGAPPTLGLLHEETAGGVASWMRGKAVEHMDAAVAVSKTVADRLPAKARAHTVVIPNAVDTSVYRPGPAPAQRAELRARLGLPISGTLIFAATRIDPAKRIEDLITMAAGLHDATLLIAGTTSCSNSYEAEMTVRADGTHGRVRLLGARNDVAQILQAVDVSVHAGTVEGMSLGLLEAQAAGLPVVAYDAAGVREVVVDEVTGSIVAPYDVDRLGRSVQRLVNDGRLRARWGQAARRRAVAQFDIQRQADAIARIIRDHAHALDDAERRTAS
ncbi:MAG: glycosyltransferase family 4 protein [Gordonia sp. (in: high G+C Gram-positive bacteria)]